MTVELELPASPIAGCACWLCTETRLMYLPEPDPAPFSALGAPSRLLVEMHLVHAIRPRRVRLTKELPAWLHCTWCKDRCPAYLALGYGEAHIDLACQGCGGQARFSLDAELHVFRARIIQDKKHRKSA